MPNCTELELQEMLPDLLHRTLDAGARSRVEAHVAECAECNEELSVLRTVAAAAVFAPAIDADKIARQIPPYRPILPVAQAPARSRVVSWLVAASMLVVVAGGGSLLMIQQRGGATQSAVRSVALQNVPASDTPAALAVAPATSEVATSEQPTHTLALAAGVDALSDGDLRQLMNDMDSFDALPSAEPEPVISVDASDNPDQGL